MYDPNLPTPAADDIDPGRTYDSSAQWTCRYCGAQETGPLTITAAVVRRVAHEYQCPLRPASDTRTPREREIYLAVHADGLRREIAEAFIRLEDKQELLRRTWFFEFRTCRSIRSEIEALKCHITGIYAHALTIGLKGDWCEEQFRPSAL